MKRQFAQFLVRWFMNAVGIFVAAQFLNGVTYQDRGWVLLVAALILSVVNVLIKPFLVILALPALLITLGVFSIVINGAMVYLAHLMYRPFHISSFGTAILAGLVIGLINYILTRLFDAVSKEEV